MTLAELDQLTRHLPEAERRELLEFARRRNQQAIRLVIVLFAYWLMLGAAIALVVLVVDK